MSVDPNQDPSTFDPDEDLFNFDEVALEFYSSNDEEDLEEIFKAFEAGIEEENDLGFDFDATDDEPAAGQQPYTEEPLAAETPEPTPAPTPLTETPAPAVAPVETTAAETTAAETTAAEAAPVEAFRADPKPTPPPAPAPIQDPLPSPQTYPATGQAPAAPAQVAVQPAPAPQVYPTPQSAPAAPPVAAAAPIANVTPPQVYPSPATVATPTTPLAQVPVTQAPAGETGEAAPARFPLLKWVKGSSPILVAVTVMNALLAVVVLKRPVAPVEPTQTETPNAAQQHVPDAIPKNELVQPATLTAPQPERHPTFALAHDEISRGEYGAARRRIYGLLSIIDRLNTEERSAIEARAQYLLAEAQHLEALSRLEASQ